MAVVWKALRDDHDRIKRLWAAFNKTPSGMSAMSIFEELRVHTTIEEELVYPALRDIAPQLADRSEDDHADQNDLMAEIEETDPSDPKFMKLMRALERDFLAHIMMEERDVFPLLRQRPGFDPFALGADAFAMRQELIADRPPSANKVRLLALTGWGSDGGKNNPGWGANAGW